jgi:hypothetical protein
MKKIIPPLFLTLSLALFSCEETTENTVSADSMSLDSLQGSQPQPTACINFYVNASGVIYANDSVTASEKIPAMLDSLKRLGGIVQYSRANPQSEPHKNALVLMDQIASRSLAIRFCTDSTFRQAAPVR